MAVIEIPCPTRRRMVGPPIRPEPETPHSTLIPKGIGYGRENFTVSHAPPGTITKRCGCRGAGTPARSGDANPPPSEDGIPRWDCPRRTPLSGGPRPGRRMVGPPIRPKPGTPHIALIPKGIGYGRENVTVSHAPFGTITKRCGCRGAGTPARSGDANPPPSEDGIPRWDCPRRTPLSGGPRPGRRMVGPPIRPKPGTPHSTRVPKRDRLRPGECHRVTCAARNHNQAIRISGGANSCAVR